MVSVGHPNVIFDPRGFATPTDRNGVTESGTSLDETGAVWSWDLSRITIPGCYYFTIHGMTVTLSFSNWSAHLIYLFMFLTVMWVWSELVLPRESDGWKHWCLSGPEWAAEMRLSWVWQWCPGLARARDERRCADSELFIDGTLHQLTRWKSWY